MLISECVKRLPGIGNVLSAYNPFIRRYGRGELITSPDRPLDHILIVASGMAFIYAIASDGSVMEGIERATYSLHCSRRQLHRLLAKLCGEGRLERIGKGRYRIC